MKNVIFSQNILGRGGYTLSSLNLHPIPEYKNIWRQSSKWLDVKWGLSITLDYGVGGPGFDSHPWYNLFESSHLPSFWQWTAKLIIVTLLELVISNVCWVKYKKVFSLGRQCNRYQNCCWKSSYRFRLQRIDEDNSFGGKFNSTFQVSKIKLLKK